MDTGKIWLAFCLKPTLVTFGGHAIFALDEFLNKMDTCEIWRRAFVAQQDVSLNKMYTGTNQRTF